LDFFPSADFNKGDFQMTFIYTIGTVVEIRTLTGAVGFKNLLKY